MNRALPAAFGLLAAATFAGAAEVLPIQRELPAAPVEIELDDCWIDIRLEAEATPTLRAQVTPEAGTDRASLEVGEAGGRLRIARAEAGDPAARLTLSLELVLDRTQTIEVRGARLGVTVRDAAGAEPAPPAVPGAEPGEAQPTTTAAAAGHRFEVTDSEVQLWGVAASTVHGNNSVVYSENGFGAMVAELNLGSLHVRGQQGSVQLTATDGETTIERLQGDVGFTLIGGSLDVREGKGRVQGSSDGGMVSTSDWNGNVDVNGIEATITLRDGSGGQVKVVAKDSTVTLDGMDGNAVVELEDGQLSVDRLTGMAKISGSRSSRLTVRNSDGTLDLTLRDESSGEVENASGTLTAHVTAGSLDISGAHIVNLTAAQSEVTVAGIRRLAKLNVQRSEVELDLRESQDRALNLRVQDDVDFTVYLPSPCRVQMQGGSGTSQGLDVSGCELQLERLGRWKGAGSRDLDGRRPFLLTATLAPNGQLRVRGG
jgi:hypothetical protein